MRTAILLFVLLFFGIQSGSCDQESIEKTPDHTFTDKELSQMIMVGFRGTELLPDSQFTRDVKRYHPGGFVLFDYDVERSEYGRNITSPEQLRKLTSQLYSLSDVPPFIAVDQEGGMVSRLKPRYGFNETRSAAYIGKLNNEDSTRFYASRVAQILSEAGINVNFAPVVDLNLNPDNPVIGNYERSFSDDPQVVIQNAKLIIEEHGKRDILSVIKHFPGHGSSDSDSHVGFTDITDSWDPTELKPYEELLDPDAHIAVMSAHIFNRNLDDTWPATLSKPIISGMLRDSLNYNGVVFSDDMQMGAIREHYGLETAIEQAIKAGIDVLIFGNNLIYEEDILSHSISIIQKLLKEGRISPERIQQSLDRIEKLKKRLYE